MRIFSVLLLLAAGLFLLPPGTGAAGFVGPGVSPTLTRAADVLNAWDDAPCVLEGHILEKIPRKDRYLFEDESGRDRARDLRAPDGHSAGQSAPGGACGLELQAPQ